MLSILSFRSSMLSSLSRHAPVLFAALVLESALLACWPSLYLAGPTSGPTTFGEMVLRFFPGGDALLWTLKAIIDVLFPGVLWTWEAVVAFFFQCIVLAFVGYAAAAWLVARRPSLPLYWVLGPVVLFQLTLSLLPAIMTTDIYSYTLYGEMPVVYGANPFTHTPSQFPQSTLYYLIPQYWHDAPSIYGPLWIAISTAVAALFHGRPLIDELIAYRVLANLAHLANTAIVWSLARRIRPGAAPVAALAYGWNPLTLMEFSLNAHNDSLMLTFLLLAARMAASRRLAPCALLLGLSVATKYTTILLAPILFVWAASGGLGAGGWGLGPGARHSALPTPHSEPVGPKVGGPGPHRNPSPSVGGGARGEGLRLFRALALGSAITVATVAVFYLPWVAGLDTLGPVLYWVTGPRLNDFWPEPALRRLSDLIGGVFGLSSEAVWDPVLAAFKLVGKLALVGLVIWELRTLGSGVWGLGSGVTGLESSVSGLSPKAGPLTPDPQPLNPSQALAEAALQSAVRVLLFFLLVVNTWIMPWYYTWPLALAAPLGWNGMLTRVCAGLGLTAFIVMYQRQFGYPVVNDWGGLTLVLPILLGLLPRFSHSLGERARMRADGCWDLWAKG